MATGGFLRAAILPALLVHSSLGISLFPFHAVAAESARVDVVLSNLPARRRAATDACKGPPAGRRSTLQQMHAFRSLAHSTLPATGSSRGCAYAWREDRHGPAGAGPAFRTNVHCIFNVGQAARDDESRHGLARNHERRHGPDYGRCNDRTCPDGRAKPWRAPPVLRIPLNASTSVAVRRTSLVKTGDRYAWRGEVEGTDEPVTLLWWPDGHVSGTIRHDGRVFTVKSATRGMHEIVEVAPKMLPPDHAPATLDLLRTMNMQDDPLVRRGMPR